MEECRTILKVLTGKEHVLFTSRGNEAIRLAMLVVSRLGRHNVLFQDEGGWMTYEKYIKQAGLEPIRLVTNDGLIHEKDLAFHDSDSVLLINSLAGYIAPHDMNSIDTACFNHNIILVNDVAGSIGMDIAKVGDIILGSFGKSKPVDLGVGGFIATSDEESYEILKELHTDEEKMDWATLKQKLLGVEKRREFLINRCNKIKADLKDMDIVHRDEEGLNVIIRFADEKEKTEILNYCDDEKLEYTICPREIRIKDDAVSIEVKRLKGP